MHLPPWPPVPAHNPRADVVEQPPSTPPQSSDPNFAQETEQQRQQPNTQQHLSAMASLTEMRLRSSAAAGPRVARRSNAVVCRAQSPSEQASSSGSSSSRRAMLAGLAAAIGVPLVAAKQASATAEPFLAASGAKCVLCRGPVGASMGGETGGTKGLQ